MKTITLMRPIVSHGGEEVKSLTLREPTVEDVMSLGMPTLLIPSADGESVGIEVRAKVIAAYVVRLAGIPMSAMKSMSLSDLSKCQGVVMDFFGEGAGEAPKS